jgi:hypothetical protein
MPWIFWNGLFCLAVTKDGDYWLIESMAGVRYLVHWFNLESAQF